MLTVKLDYAQAETLRGILAEVLDTTRSLAVYAELHPVHEALTDEENN
jgi:hypothetical protein